MINLKNLDLSTLPSLPLKDRKSLPLTSCVYFAIANGIVQYIGRSANLRGRWSAHHRRNEFHPDSHIAWIEIGDSALLPEIERALIAWFKPPLNGKVTYTEAKSGIEVITQRVAVGAHQNVSVLVEDLEALKRLQH
jgi:excinuclease UvrABC nuclease subunit